VVVGRDAAIRSSSAPWISEERSQVQPLDARDTDPLTLPHAHRSPRSALFGSQPMYISDHYRPYTGLLALLVRDRLLSATAAARIDRVILESWTPLGTILVKHGVLSMGELAALLELQARAPQMRLGELAVREGYCTQAEVDDAVQAQAAATPALTDLLLAEIPAERDQLCRALLRYVSQLEGRLADLQIAV